MPDWLKVVILGIVEGITEFLPISSTGHLIVATALLDFGGSLRSTFEIFIQFGAVVAVILFYRVELWSQMRRVPSDRQVQRFWLAIAVAFVPAGAIGFLLSDRIDELLFNPTVVAIALIVGGIVFLLVERQDRTRSATTAEMTAISLRQALLIGVAQTVALIPGVSRSGASIIGGMLAGLNRETATRFSFFLAIPTLGIATLYQLFKNLGRIQGSDLFYLLLGAGVSAVVAWLSIDWLLRYVSRNSFVAFGFYRILAGLLILALAAGSQL